MKFGTGAMGPPSMLGEMAQGIPITPRQPVQFSEEMEGVVTPLSEQRKSARGRYLVGGTINKRTFLYLFYVLFSLLLSFTC